MVMIMILLMTCLGVSVFFKRRRDILRKEMLFREGLEQRQRNKQMAE